MLLFIIETRKKRRIIVEKKQSKLIRFLGGKTSYYILGLLILSAFAIFLFHRISFIFKPFWVIFATTMPPLLFTLIIYYLLDPIITRMSKKMSRSIALVIVYCVILTVLGFAGVLVYPILQKQAEDLIQQFPKVVNDVQVQLQQFAVDTPFADSLNQISHSIDQATKNLSAFIGDYWQSGAEKISNIFSAITTTFITLFTGPIIAFFLLKDPRKFYQTTLDIVPPAFREDFRSLVRIANRQLGGFIKGQIIASLLLGAIYWGIFLLIGLKFASILAIAAGILCIVPYIGPFVAFFPGLFIAFQDSTFMAVKFVIVWFAVQLLHGDLIIPKVMGNRLNIHPITILIILLVMGDLLGLVGVIFGIPFYTLVKLLVVYLFRKFKQRYNRYYGDKGTYDKSAFSEEDYFE
ncbi:MULTISPECIES: AI-2E family transporter [unclassified Enterococcus]|jgi:predicted PurR-regulated permease PerM|uniref:AI-2E family transporter n=1 Tax=unclassified Enterococcus TaxID=2608891 RepID=UPI003D2DC354